MKVLPSLILNFILIGSWSCSDAGLVNPGNEDNCEGSTVKDICGICDGDGSTCNITFSETIQPIFAANCSSCHIASTRNNLSLSNYSSITSGNSSNGPVIVAGDHTNSLLWQYVNSGTMPPGNSNLTASQIDLIETWIDEGALEEPLDN